MDQGRVSSCYARALLAWVTEKGLAQEAYGQSETLYTFLAGSNDFKNLISSPVVSPQKKMDVASKVVTTIAPLLVSIVTLAIKNGREKQLPFIMLTFQKLYREQSNTVRTLIESANELSDETVKGISRYISQSLGKTVEIQTRIKPELIGGFVLTINDSMLDRSVKGEIDKFKKQLLG